MSSSRTLIAADIGNSRIKVGLFDQLQAATERVPNKPALAAPSQTLDLRTAVHTGEFDAAQLCAWCEAHVADDAEWRVASVHRQATSRLIEAVEDWARRAQRPIAIRQLTNADVPLAVEVEVPERVGIDRLLGALAADRLRAPRRPAIVVDLGSAITVDLLTADGAFAGGAILPGIAMAARALEEQTDALPHVPVEQLQRPPNALGKSTIAAIESGLFWGTIGAIRELVDRLSLGLAETPEVFLAGGGAAQVAELVGSDRPVVHVPHLVLSGIALVSAKTPQQSRRS